MNIIRAYFFDAYIIGEPEKFWKSGKNGSKKFGLRLV